MPDYRLSRRAMMASAVGWKKARGSQTKKWHHSMKLLVIGLSHVGKYRITGCDDWLETG